MNPTMQPAIQHLFQVSTVEEIPREQLERLTREFPCFGYGHYLLSLKLRAENDDRFLVATQKTSLYFPNPFWLQWMLENASAPAPTHSIPRPGPAPMIVEPPSPTYTDDIPEPQAAGPATEPSDSGSDADTARASAAEILLESIEKTKELRESLQKINEDFVARTGHPIPAREPLHEEQPAEPPMVRDEEPPFILDETDQVVEVAQTPESVAEAPSPEPVAAPAEPSTDLPVPEPVEEAQTPEPSAVAPFPQSAAAEPFPQSAAQPVEMPLFEPLHTIDYFASQGIRLSPDDNPADQLGRQLKSFTEWLRMMRRLPQKGREIVPDRVAEEAVQHFAAHSIEGKEVVTETMAEVLAKQGMPERARLVYEKLSLLSPDKSAYFAAKIEQLNTH